MDKQRLEAFMNGTKKLYYEQPYLAQFCAKVLSCTPVAGGHFAVVLDQTAFYPEGGGQPADHGSLGGACVLDARDEDGTVVHITASPVRVARPYRAMWTGCGVLITCSSTRASICSAA